MWLYIFALHFSLIQKHISPSPGIQIHLLLHVLLKEDPVLPRHLNWLGRMDPEKHWHQNILLWVDCQYTCCFVISLCLVLAPTPTP